LGALVKGYKTRRILSEHKGISSLKKEYRDLLGFAFALQVELRQKQQTAQA